MVTGVQVQLTAGQHTVLRRWRRTHNGVEQRVAVGVLADGRHWAGRWERGGEPEVRAFTRDFLARLLAQTWLRPAGEWAPVEPGAPRDAA